MWQRAVSAVGGGGSTPIVDTFNASTTPKTYTTKNATVVIADTTIISVINGKKYAFAEPYPTLQIITYDETTNVLSISGASGTSYPVVVYYEP